MLCCCLCVTIAIAVVIAIVGSGSGCSCYCCGVPVALGGKDALAILLIADVLMLIEDCFEEGNKQTRRVSRL